MIYEIAGLKIKINNKHRFTTVFCADYLAEKQDEFDIEATADKDEIEREKEASVGFSDGYIENICIYRNICSQMPMKNRFLLHSSVVDYGGKCYAFLGRSGTGKSTHTGLWLRNLPEAKILNGDKPIIEMRGDKFIVYGTPWQGKEGLGYNGKAELDGICFLEQSKTNEIEKLSSAKVAERLFTQVLLPDDAKAVAKTLEMLDSLCRNVSGYLLKCDISDEAFKTSFEAMTGKKTEENHG